jgi:hypothetical protein
LPSPLTELTAGETRNTAVFALRLLSTLTPRSCSAGTALLGSGLRKPTLSWTVRGVPSSRPLRTLTR